MAERSKRRVGGRGGSPRSAGSRRSLIAVALVGFVLMAVGVIFRRTYGRNELDDLKRLEAQRDSLRAARIQLENAIVDASSRSRLGPIAEQRLNMHIPTPDQQILLPRPARGRGSRQ
jgi:cell division protein FtsL